MINNQEEIQQDDAFISDRGTIFYGSYSATALASAARFRCSTGAAEGKCNAGNCNARVVSERAPAPQYRRHEHRTCHEKVSTDYMAQEGV